MDENELQNRVLEFVGREGYQPLKPRAIARKLGLSKEEAPLLKRAVKRLVRDGRLAYGANHLVRSAKVAQRPKNQVIGTFHRTQKGFGFVRPKAPAPRAGDAAATAPARADDIYIPAKRAGDASTGDVVVVRLRPGRAEQPGPRGEIVEILERQTQRFVGTYFERGGAAYVQVDGSVFAQPVSVGDPGAKNAQTNDKVVFEMVRFPSPAREGEGVITEVLGPRGQPGVDTLSIIREFDLPEEFSEEALDVARAAANAFDEEKFDGRLDLRGETIITIDPADARDFDDAISLVRLDNGRWRLGVHIADVSYFVSRGTTLDREAYDRATSVYLPDRVLPMLPEIISNSLASLQPDRLRYTKTVFMEFDDTGLRLASEFHSAAIRSAKRLNYGEVDEFLADPAAKRAAWGEAVCDLLGRMHALAMVLRRRRRERGALELIMPEVKIDLGAQGEVVGAHVVENTVSHQIIEEFMLAANEAVAEMLRDRELHFLRRVHQPPAPHKVKALTEFVRELGLKCGNLESRFELQKLLDSVADRPERHAVNFATLRSMQRAVYSPEDKGHFALASDCYCHFTSPIRRYPDLTVHRLLDTLLAERPPVNDFDAAVIAGKHCSDREQRAEDAERELTKLKLLTYLSSRIGLEMEAIVTGVESYGLFVQGTALPAEGLVHADSLTDDYYFFDRDSHTLSGRRGRVFRLGDVLKVEVARVDLERRELDFRLVTSGRAARGGTGPAPRGYVSGGAARGEGREPSGRGGGIRGSGGRGGGARGGGGRSGGGSHGGGGRGGSSRGGMGSTGGSRPGGKAKGPRPTKGQGGKPRRKK